VVIIDRFCCDSHLKDCKINKLSRISRSFMWHRHCSFHPMAELSMGRHVMSIKTWRHRKAFIDQLRDAVSSLKEMKPGAVHILSVNARYGRYQIEIGPEKEGGPPRKRHGRSIEITGEIHHLFVSESAVRANPSRKQLRDNMRDTVIMKDLAIHVVDPDGRGDHLARQAQNSVQARECINLAGDDGADMIEEAKSGKRITMEAYRIAQEDILRALEEKTYDT
jgi:hypothetical protein